MKPGKTRLWLVLSYSRRDYLVGDPMDPQVVWRKLADQFQKKSWANKLELKRKLFSMKQAMVGRCKST